MSTKGCSFAGCPLASFHGKLEERGWLQHWKGFRDGLLFQLHLMEGKWHLKKQKVMEGVDNATDGAQDSPSAAL